MTEKEKVKQTVELIKAKNLRAEIIWHLDKTGETTADALRVHKIPSENLLKCLLLIDKQHRPLIVMITGDKRIDFAKLEMLSGLSKLRLARKEEMDEILGKEQGEVAPIGLPEIIPVFIDEKVMSQEFVMGSAGSKFAGLKIIPMDILKCTNARTEDVSENGR
jgi:prolyl-tRNA editing enzyme YbaK/EbsC (Cys-tRNA(Pro) deacylase)